MNKIPLPKKYGFPLAILIVSLSLGLQYVLHSLIGGAVYIGIYFTALLCSWLGGTPVGIFSVAFLVLGFDLFFMGPGVMFDLTSVELTRTISFITTNLIVIGVLDRLRKAEKKLKESEFQYRMMVEFSPHIVWFSSGDGSIIYVNQNWTNYTKWTLEDIKAKGWDSLIHPADLKYSTEAWRESVRTKRPLEFENRLLRHDGEYRWFLISARPVLKANGEVEKWIGKSVDIHEQKMAIAARDIFFAIATHELNTPLTSLKLQMEVLQSRLIDRDSAVANELFLKNFVETFTDKVDNIRDLIKEMMDVAKITSGQMKYQFSSVEISKIVSNAIETVSTEYSNKNVQLKVDFTDNCVLSCDQAKLTQVFINLLTNALKYGDGNPVFVKLKKESNLVKVDVIDQGPGIPTEDQTKIFNCYERLDKNNEAGLGVGLFISRQIVEDHKGNILLNSKCGEGSTFSVELPLS